MLLHCFNNVIESNHFQLLDYLMAECLYECREHPDIRARRKLGFHAVCPNHDSLGGRLGRYSLNRKLFRFYSDERTALVLCLVKSFFPDDSQPVIVAVLTDSVLQAPCPHALTALLPLMNQLSPLVYPCDSFCLPVRMLTVPLTQEIVTCLPAGEFSPFSGSEGFSASSQSAVAAISAAWVSVP